MQEFTLSNILSNLLLATRWTIALSAIAFIGGGIVGFLVMLMRISPNKIIKYLSLIYVEFFQGTPLLMQLFLTFFGLSVIFNLNLSPWIAAAIALTTYTSAFLAEIWRGSVAAIPKGQWEASTALGLNYFKQLQRIILPQAIKMSIPPTVGFAVQVIKGTSLASVIGFVELTRSATAISNVTFKPFLVFTIAAVIYFCLCFPLSLWSKHLEQKFAYKY
ncbi:MULTISPECIES: amino acid ABC transporter permease [Kamptonema]|uniref:amino acid ABC transporter permease n=1 Tax=Kamptonema TaxID=1501433 RepID=UPI0001DACB80|nr:MULTISPECIES: amino acid ABC transporter permease [Kamptonema]MDF0552391.1 amino acid ABC transporter permease [Kamptonema sp. UHCC 0994]CBN58655.1 putative ABC transporter, permease protein [Kamptonema sp. PCC 6506]HLO50194.1 amino acid ABC transporter permease [Kamptonema sp.]